MARHAVVAIETIARARTADGAEIATVVSPGTKSGAGVGPEIRRGGAGLVRGGDLGAETDTTDGAGPVADTGGAGPGTDIGGAGPGTGGTGRGGAGHPEDVEAPSLPSGLAEQTTSSTSEM